MIKKPYQLFNGEKGVDAKQVNVNFDVLYKSIGNGGIENVYSIVKHTDFPGDGSDSYVELDDGVETTIFSQAISLSEARHCLIMASLGVGYYADDYDTTQFYIYNDSTQLVAVRQNEVGGHISPVHLSILTQIPSGSHTIYVKGQYSSGGGSGTAVDVYDRTLTIIQFAF